MVAKSGKVGFEYRGSAPLTSVAFNGQNLVAFGDIKGIVKVFEFSLAEGLKERPVIEGQVLNADIQKLVFCSPFVLAAGGGTANSAARQFMTIFRIILASKEFKLLGDGTGGPTRAVNDITCVGGLVAFASDDRSVTLFRVDEKGATFYKGFSDYGGLVGRVILSEDAQLIAYGSGGSTGKFLMRQVENADQPAIQVCLEHPNGRIFFDSDNKLSSEDYTNASVGSAGAIKTVIEIDESLLAYNHVGALVFTLPMSAKIGSLQAESEKYTATADSRRIKVINKETGEPVRTSGWTSHDSTITSLVFFDDTRLVSAGLDGHVFLWGVNSPLRPIASMPNAHHGPISTIAMTPCQEIISFGQEDGAIRIFSLTSSS
jgi:hypothetical protein